MTIRGSVLLASLVAGAVAVTGCQDPRGLGVKREKARSDPPSQYQGNFYRGGYESPGAISKPIGEEGVKVADMEPPYHRAERAEQRGTGGSGVENPLASDQPAGVSVQPGAASGVPYVPGRYYPGSWQRRDAGTGYHGGFQTNRNNDDWGPSAPIPSGDQPDDPPRQPSDLRPQP